MGSPIIEALGGKACVIGSGAAVQALDGFEYTVMDTGGFKEVVLCHTESKSLVASDSIYIGCADKDDPSGWKKHAAPEWSRLYFKAFCERSSSHLPIYRMMLNKAQQKAVASTLQTILSWQPERVLASRSGRIPEAG